MSDPKSAEENLKVIRDLMERATKYRALATVPALIGAILTLLAGVWGYWKGDSLTATKFVLLWLGVLLAIDAVNSVSLYRDSKKRGADFPSPQMIHGILAMLPAFLAGGIIGLVFGLEHEDPVKCATIWAVFSGLALLATRSFAPRSILKLGWLFLIAGTGFFVWYELGGALPGRAFPIKAASFVMMAAFGGPLALYAIFTGLISKTKEG
ncbi:MAG: hypothetical protein HKN23_12815 [Verrucomicrobiales bacterium]|nr:hypothetical protein [Verrucomicrobiales bacterium]